MNKKNSVNFQQGYTLVELLVVILVVIITGVIIANTLFYTLKAGDKEKAISNLKQDGNFAISQMVKSITYAKSFDGFADAAGTFFNDCIPQSAPTPTPNPNQIRQIKITSFDGGQTTFICNPGACTGSTSISSKSAALAVAADLTSSSVCVSECNFTCAQSSSFSPVTIGIHFRLQQKSGNFSENQASIIFDTTATMRNTQ